MRIHFLILFALAIPVAARLRAQDLASRAPLPRVSTSTLRPKVRIPTTSGPQRSRPAHSHPRSTSSSAGRSTPRSLYPWKLAITTTVFWIGERPGANNPTPNNRSSWDQNWEENFGGYDDPNPGNRIADHRTGDFRPKAFVPKLNPFYVALPYNDRLSSRRHKPEAARVIPWFSRSNPGSGETVLRGRWIQIHRNGRNCYAQWEDCGPWVTNDWQYVFGSAPPKNKRNGGAGIDISPAIRDCLGIRSGQKVHWRFVEAGQVPYGPWKRYGKRSAAASKGPDIEAQRRYLQYLRKLRDKQFLEKSVIDLQS